MKTVALALTALAFVPGLLALTYQGSVEAKEVSTERGACKAIKAHVAAIRHIDTGSIAFCDVVLKEYQPQRYIVLALHAKPTDCDGCSTNMGWFAVRKSTGRIFEWNVAEWRLGAPI